MKEREIILAEASKDARGRIDLMSLLISNHFAAQHMRFLLLCYGTGRISDILCFGCGLSSEAFLLLVQIRIIVLGMSARVTITSS